MKIFKPTIILTILLHITCFASAQNFQINGTVAGLADGTKIYIRTAKPDKNLDSTTVKNGQFVLKGKMNDKISNVYLHTAKYSNYVNFWLEEQPLTINLKAGEFKNAIIKGSLTQEEDNIWAKLHEDLIKQEDSITNLFNKEQNANKKAAFYEQLEVIRKANQQVDIAYIKNNPNSLISANLLDVYAASWGKEQTEKLYTNFSVANKNTTYGKNIGDFIKLNKAIKIGGQFVDFEQTNTTGKLIKLSDIKAKYILLEFWGSWCGPCRAENPNLVKTYHTFKQKGFEILGVAADENKEQWLKAIKDDRLPWENVCDLKGDKNKAAIIYGINAYPTNFLIDSTGKIIAKNLRGEALANKLTELLP